MEKGYIQFGNRIFYLEEAKFSSWLYYGKFQDWTFELYPPGEDNYIMLNSINLGIQRFPDDLVGYKRKFDAKDDEMCEHTVFVDGTFSRMITLEITVIDWDPSIDRLIISGKGTIVKEGEYKSIPYEFFAACFWQGMDVHRNYTEEVIEDIFGFWNLNVQDVEIVCNKAFDGVSCLVKRLNK